MSGGWIRWLVPSCLVLVLMGCGTGNTAGSTPQAAGATDTPARATARATDTPEPTDTPRPTATPRPTDTPEPTNTPTPTDTPTATPIVPRQLSVGRTNHYRGLDVTVDQVSLAHSIEGNTPDRDEDVLLGVQLTVHNPNSGSVDFCSWRFADSLRVERADGSAFSGQKTAGDLFNECPTSFLPGLTSTGWLLYELRTDQPLEPLKLVMGTSNETPAPIPFTGPEQQLTSRDWSVDQSVGPVGGLIWTTSGGTIGVGIPNQQANPGQEFIQLKLRVINTLPRSVDLAGQPRDVLRLQTDSGSMLAPSEVINPLLPDSCCSVPQNTELDALYAWQVPMGQQNPSLVIQLDKAGASASLPIGPLPPPAAPSSGT